MVKDADYEQAKRILRSSGGAFNAFLKIIEFHQERNIRKLAQSEDQSNIYRAQGAVRLLKQLEEIKNND